MKTAKLLEEAKFHGIFFADVLGIYDVYGNDNAPALRSAAQIPILDISLLISALAYETKHISFGITASTTYENPYALARKFSTLDQITNGRVAWNIVTSYLQSAADSFGLDQQVEHDERYKMADEFLEVVYKLLEGSWEDDAVQADKATGVYANPAKVHKINHVGKYYKCVGPNLVDPTPQRTPFLFQAGASKSGMAFAAAHAEAMFLPGMIPAKTQQIVHTVRGILKDIGRPETSVKFLAGMFIVVGETDEEAHAKYQDLLQYVDLEGTAALFGGWTGTDLSKFSDDEDFAFNGPPAIQGLINSWAATAPGGTKWTKKRVLQELSICGAHPKAVGSATTVADILETWINEAEVDGFNLSYATTPGTFEDMIKYLWPELRRRGVLQTEYSGKTMRESFLGDGGGPRVRKGHPANRFKHVVN